MKKRHVLSVLDFGPEALVNLVERSVAIAKGEHVSFPLKGQMAGIYFRGTSTRTRTSFTVGAHRLGAGVIYYGANDLQIATGETIQDTARVLSGFLDILVIRTNGSLREMELFASQDTMAVVNAMSENEHPTQVIADLTTIRESLGRLSNVHILYLGEGNNTAASLALAVAQIRGMALTVITPPGYGIQSELLSMAQNLGRDHGAIVEQHHDLDHLPKNVDAVYTTRWQTMGVQKPDPDWKSKFRPYSVTPSLMARVSKSSDTIFLHDLPAVRGDDVADAVLDGAQSRAFRQAQHKLHSAMAVLSWCNGQD